MFAGNYNYSFTAVARDQFNNVIPGVHFVFTSTNTSVATISPGSSFVYGVAVGSAGIYASSGTIQSNMATVTVIVPTYTLQITKNGTGTGTVTSSPTGINCGLTCSATFNTTDAITLTAAPSPGSTLTGWAGFCAGTVGPSCVLDANLFSGGDTAAVYATFGISTTPVLTSIVLSPSSASVSAGGTFQFTASAIDQYGSTMTGVAFVFSSTNTAVATINSSSGLAIGVAVGATGVYASHVAIQSNMAVLTVTDTTPPTVVISSPSNNATIQGTISVTGTANDNVGVASVQIKVDNGSYVSATGTNSWSYSLNTMTLTNSSHTITALATDTSGNPSTPSTISVVVYNPVVLTLTSIVLTPASAFVSIGGTQQFTASGRDQFGNPMTGVTFAFSSNNTSVATMNSTSGLATGVAVGSAGMSASSGWIISNTATLTVGDTTPPTVPTNLTATAISASQIDLAWTASTDPDSPVQGYKIYRNGAFLGTTVVNDYSDTGLAPSTLYTYTVAAVDPSGNTSAQSTPGRATTLASTNPTASPKPGLRNVYSYPNPAVGQDPVIRIMMGVVSSIDITIFDSSDHVVHSVTLDGPPTNIFHGEYYYDYRWTARKASGIYFVVIHGKAQDGGIIKARTTIAVVK
jgi:hypothetical protein